MKIVKRLTRIAALIGLGLIVMWAIGLVIIQTSSVPEELSLLEFDSNPGEAPTSSVPSERLYFVKNDNGEKVYLSPNKQFLAVENTYWG